MPGICRSWIRPVLALPRPHAADDQPVGCTSQGNVKQAHVLLDVALFLVEDDFLERRTTFVLFRAEKWHGRLSLELDINRQRSPAETLWIGCCVSEDHHWRLKTLGAVNRHDPHLVASMAGVA